MTVISMKVIGLTGSIAMGKTTTAQMFRNQGIPVNDSDFVVHQLYKGEAIPLIERHFPQAIVDGMVDRNILGKYVLNDGSNLKLLESIVHPLVQQKRSDFIRSHAQAGYRLIVLDIPLLFETEGQGEVDLVVVVSASSEIQRKRALSRSGMTEAKFQAILSKQLPDMEKRRRAHCVIRSDLGIEIARQQVKALLRALS